jgi:hypothetical protein
MSHYFFDIKDGHRLLDKSGSDVRLNPKDVI